LIATCASLPAFANQGSSEDAKAISAFSVPVPIDGGPVWVTIVTDRTVDAMWRDAPAKDWIRFNATMNGLMLSVMGIATKDFVLAPEYSIEQGGTTSLGQAINIRNLSGGEVKRGDSILGLVAFKNKIDLSKPFILNFGGCRVEVVLNPDEVKKWGALSTPPGFGVSSKY
jgi:hypothetical protein